MRQGQQNRRGRGRNRKGHHHNPLTRSFESNGPDVKIRGTPAHIAEKYISLARDAQASGDPVLAESYLQYAEHYNRIIMSYREQQMQQGDMTNGGGGRFRPLPGAEPMESADEFGDEDGEEVTIDGQAAIRGQEPQPRTFDPQPRGDDRPQRFDGRPPHRERFGEQRPMQQGERPERVERAPEAAAMEPAAPQVRGEPPRRRDRLPESHEQPEFLRRPVRRPRRDGPPRQQNGSDQDAAPAPKDDDPIDKTPA
jgi:hypothetical protein